MTPRGPIEPEPCRWELPDPWLGPPGDDVLGIGADLEPGTLLAAYRSGLFPMHLETPDGSPRLAWWSPDPRGVIPLDRLRVPRSLRRSLRRFTVTTDRHVDDVIAACAHEHAGPQWIVPEIRTAYRRLYELGWVHSVEVHDAEGRLVGGLYGVQVGGLFAGESMFHRVPDASKAALVALVAILRYDGDPRRLLDVQWATDHLRTMGAVDIPRTHYLELLAQAVPLDPPRWSGVDDQA
jgi:leucyl/phenylalanyl-tRNA--protein transferase